MYYIIVICRPPVSTEVINLNSILTIQFLVFWHNIRVHAQRYGFDFYPLYDYNRIRFQPYVFLMRAQITQIKYRYTQLLLSHISVVICCRSLAIPFADGLLTRYYNVLYVQGLLTFIEILLSANRLWHKDSLLLWCSFCNL